MSRCWTGHLDITASPRRRDCGSSEQSTYSSYHCREGILENLFPTSTSAQSPDPIATRSDLAVRRLWFGAVDENIGGALTDPDVPLQTATASGLADASKGSEQRRRSPDRGAFSLLVSAKEKEDVFIQTADGEHLMSDEQLKRCQRITRNAGESYRPMRRSFYMTLRKNPTRYVIGIGLCNWDCC